MMSSRSTLAFAVILFVVLGTAPSASAEDIDDVVNQCIQEAQELFQRAGPCDAVVQCLAENIPSADRAVHCNMVQNVEELCGRWCDPGDPCEDPEACDIDDPCENPENCQLPCDAECVQSCSEGEVGAVVAGTSLCIGALGGGILPPDDISVTAEGTVFGTYTACSPVCIAGDAQAAVRMVFTRDYFCLPNGDYDTRVLVEGEFAVQHTFIGGADGGYAGLGDADDAEGGTGGSGTAFFFAGPFIPPAPAAGDMVGTATTHVDVDVDEDWGARLAGGEFGVEGRSGGGNGPHSYTFGGSGDGLLLSWAKRDNAECQVL